MSKKILINKVIHVFCTEFEYNVHNLAKCMIHVQYVQRYIVPDVNIHEKRKVSLFLLANCYFYSIENLAKSKG